MSEPAKPATYRIRHGAEYNRALVRRDSRTISVASEALDAWHPPGPPRWGAKVLYRDTAIPCLLTRRAVFHRPLRTPPGRAQAVFEVRGLDLDGPHYRTLCRRAADLEVDRARQSGGRGTGSGTARG